MITDDEFLTIQSEIAGAIRDSLTARGIPFQPDMVNVYVHRVAPKHMPPLLTTRDGNVAWADDRDGMDMLTFFQRSKS